MSILAAALLSGCNDNDKKDTIADGTLSCSVKADGGEIVIVYDNGSWKQKEECKAFVEILIGEKFSNDSDELLEKDITKKINLYSFMNYKIGTQPDEICDKIIEKALKISSNPESNKYNYSELIILFDNEFDDDNIINNINIIRKKFFEDNKNRIFFKKKPNLIPFIIILSSKDLILKDFIPSKINHFKINFEDIM